MTTKEIAEAAGVSVDTVARKIKELYPERMQTGKRTALLQNEAIKVMAEIRKVNFVQPTQFAEVNNDMDTAFKLAIITLTNMAQNLDARMSRVEARIDQRQALLPAPEVKPRDNVSRIVRQYAHDNNVEFRQAWGELYREYGYRTNSNPTVSARNRGMAIIDYIEAEGMIGTLESIAIDWGK